MSTPEITPEMKVGDLLRAYPQLEETLIGLSSEFRRLQSPVLRATVAKVATLQQVAQVGGIGVGEVIRTFDTRPLIEAGEHPLGLVVQATEALQAGEILELVTPFEPAPLIDQVRHRGFLAWVGRDGDGIVRTWFQRE